MQVNIYDWDKTFDENVAAGPNPEYKSDQIQSDTKDLSFDLFGYRVGSRFGSAACPAGTDLRYMEKLLVAGFDIVTTKTRRSSFVKANPMPNLLAVEPKEFSYESNQSILPVFHQIEHITNTRSISLVNSFGNNSLDPSSWLSNDTKLHQQLRPDQLVITSIVGTLKPDSTIQSYYEDFAKTASLAKSTGTRAIEINFSCPNVAHEGILCYDKEAVFSVCKLVREVIGQTPLVAKFGYFNARQYELLRSIVSSIAPYINGISAINTIPVEVEPLHEANSLYGGLSGFPIKQYGLAMVRRLAAIRDELRANYVIFGIGGVLQPSDYQEYRNSGADVVLAASGALYNPNLAREIKETLQSN